MANEIDHEFTENIVCPHCGHEFMDCFEFPNTGTDECSECGGEFEYEREVIVTYNTSKI